MDRHTRIALPLTLHLVQTHAPNTAHTFTA